MSKIKLPEKKRMIMFCVKCGYPVSVLKYYYPDNILVGNKSSILRVYNYSKQYKCPNCGHKNIY